MNEDEKQRILIDLNLQIGSDINNLRHAYELENELISKRKELQSSLKDATNEVPTKLSKSVQMAEQNCKRIETLQIRSESLKSKIEKFLQRIEPLHIELDKRFSAIRKLENVLVYLKSFDKIEELCTQMKQCNDDEQLVLWYGELKNMCGTYKTGHRANYIREYTHYWHNVLKDKLTKNYEEQMKLLKWPLVSVKTQPSSPPPKEVLTKFQTITKYLFLIEEPKYGTVEAAVSESFEQEQDPCLPVRLLLRPIKKRFMFHFTGSRVTARIDRPEWFLTQTLKWIKGNQIFVRDNVQPVADKLELKKVRAVDEFNLGVMELAAERLHTILGLYHSQGSKSEVVDVDAAFAHAVDETLGFHRELIIITGNDTNTVLSVLTKAEVFVKWLAVEKKYALAKMDEILSSEQWTEPVAAGIEAAVGSLVWVPRGADWFVSLLKTIEDRYAILPQPGHRLQFLELQLELMEEWRVRLTQLLSAAVESLLPKTFLVADASPHPLTAIINIAHYTRTILLQWAHSLHYLQLHYYRRQFQHFTQQQHRDESESSASSSDEEEESEEDDLRRTERAAETLLLKEVVIRAKSLAWNELSKRESMTLQDIPDEAIAIANLSVTEPLNEDTEAEESGVFAEAPGLIAHLRDSGLTALGDHIMMEFKAGLRDYTNQKWHAWLLVEEKALCVSPALCRPLSALCARLTAAGAKLAPTLTSRLRAKLASEVGPIHIRGVSDGKLVQHGRHNAVYARRNAEPCACVRAA
ncbi:hypothetical protein ACJJTC_004084 [Scirpophaga incertulas]